MRGEYLEAELKKVSNPDKTYQLYTIEFDIKESMKSGLDYIIEG